MDEKWSIDFKKFKKSSSKKLKKGGLGFFLSPREDAKDSGSFKTSHVHLSSPNKVNNWDNEELNLEANIEETEVQDKDYIGDIPIIPCLDDFVDDDLTKQIAKAPLIGIKNVANYKDLETDLLKHSAFATIEEVNLQVLIKLIHPESSLDEPDVLWTKDGLFNDVPYFPVGLTTPYNFTLNQKMLENAPITNANFLTFPCNANRLYLEGIFLTSMKENIWLST